jgi:peptidoglycan-associated lipoprotein
MRRNKWLAFAMVMIMAAMFSTVSCAKKATQTEASPVPEQQAENTGSTGITPPAEESPPADPPAPEVAAASDEGEQPTFVDAKIYFEFDSAVLTGQAQQVLMDQAEYLHSNTNVRLTLEGHCDERGTEAYNMALGQRRADSVMKFLVDMGISTGRLATISYGEERPAVVGGNESAWAQNRRVQCVTN